MINEDLKAKGDVEIEIQRKNLSSEFLDYRNTVLINGRKAIAYSLAHIIADEYNFHITKMVFGNGGATNGIKKVVDSARNGLFGITNLSKPAISNIDNSIPTQVIFTSVITFEEANGVTLNEMGLQMASGDLYSMTTFPDLNKTEDIQLIFNWRLNFI